MNNRHHHTDAGDDGAVRVETTGVRHDERTADVGIDEAHRRFGGIDIPATLAAMLAALGLTVLLGGIAGAIGSYGYQRGADNGDLSIGGLVAGLVVLAVAFLVGGWVAGRMARYDGLRNGIVAALWFLAVVAGLSALGAWAGDRYDFLDEIGLPTGSPSSTARPIAPAVLGVVVMLAAAAIGGKAGPRYHRRADALIARTREGGIVR